MSQAEKPDQKVEDLPPAYQPQSQEAAVEVRSMARGTWFWCLVFYAGVATAVIICMSVVGSLHIKSLEVGTTERPHGEWKAYETTHPETNERLEVFVDVIADKEMIRDVDGSVIVVDFYEEVTALYLSDIDECRVYDGVYQTSVNATTFATHRSPPADSQVVTDPVELWSAPDSRARQEMDYFKKSFNPFYRTTMMIITPNDQSLWSHEGFGESSDRIILGPALRKEFLLEVLKLQQTVTNLAGFSDKLNRTVNLTDVCFQPLAPDNNNCTIESALNYFQNSAENLNKTFVEEQEWWDVLWADYISHIQQCSRNPMSIDDTTKLHMSCLGEYGGPIYPNVVFGGYPAPDNYENATALVITFLINNLDNATFQEMAVTWEAAFLKYIKDFHSDTFTVAYSAEQRLGCVKGDEVTDLHQLPSELHGLCAGKPTYRLVRPSADDVGAKGYTSCRFLGCDRYYCYWLCTY